MISNVEKGLRLFNDDPALIFIAGYSDEGFMSYRMEVDHGDLAAAFACLAGAKTGQWKPSVPVPVLDVHGSDGYFVFSPRIGPKSVGRCQDGGRSLTGEKKFIEGPPELLAEICASRASYDLNVKKEAYCRNGVLEYIAWRAYDGELDWFALSEGRYKAIEPGADGLYRSGIFPGLWLDARAILRGDMAKVVEVLQRGLQSPEHAAFVERLAKIAAEKEGNIS